MDILLLQRDMAIYNRCHTEEGRTPARAHSKQRLHARGHALTASMDHKVTGGGSDHAAQLRQAGPKLRT